MAKLHLIKPGQTLWSVGRYRDGANRSVRGVWDVRVVEVHEDHAICSWNGNKARRYSARELEKLRVKRPAP